MLHIFIKNFSSILRYNNCIFLINFKLIFNEDRQKLKRSVNFKICRGEQDSPNPEPQEYQGSVLYNLSQSCFCLWTFLFIDILLTVYSVLVESLLSCQGSSSRVISDPQRDASTGPACVKIQCQRRLRPALGLHRTSAGYGMGAGFGYSGRV